MLLTIRHEIERLYHSSSDCASEISMIPIAVTISILEEAVTLRLNAHSSKIGKSLDS